MASGQCAAQTGRTHDCTQSVQAHKRHLAAHAAPIWPSLCDDIFAGLIPLVGWAALLSRPAAASRHRTQSRQPPLRYSNCAHSRSPSLRYGPAGAACLIQRASSVAFRRPPYSLGSGAREVTEDGWNVLAKAVHTFVSAFGAARLLRRASVVAFRRPPSSGFGRAKRRSIDGQGHSER
jgi:hypothetical protein